MQITKRDGASTDATNKYKNINELRKHCDASCKLQTIVVHCIMQQKNAKIQQQQK